MPRHIEMDDILGILHSGDFDQLIGGLEDDHLECKSTPYDLNQEGLKMELAKDVSALANTDGGIILIGVQTEQQPQFRGDAIRRVRCFGDGLIDFGQYRNVISDWVQPAIQGLRLNWHPSTANRDEGIASVYVPLEASRERPYVVVKFVENRGRTIGSYIGFFQRTGENVTPMKPAELRDRIKDGRRFAELDARLTNIEEMVGRLTVAQAPQEPVLFEEVVSTRVQHARQELGYDGQPTFSLAAWPLEHIDFPNLFESRNEHIVRLLENPPRLRDAGFDISTRSPSSIVEGRLRRCLIPNHKILELWRDGSLISVLPGDDWHLCWGMHSTPETGLKLNTRALIETVYSFCDWTLQAFALAVPPPREFRIRMALSDMNVNGRRFSLTPGPLNQMWLDDGRRPAPNATQEEQFNCETDRVNGEAGITAYRVLFQLYVWFGFEAEEMPYVDRDQGPARIDPNQLRLVR